MIHHVSFGTSDAGRAQKFYDPVLAVLGIRRLNVRDGSVDYGVGTLLFSLERPADGRPATVGNGSHVAFAAEDRAMVDAFYRTALANGGSDAGAPGLRPDYDDHYYGAFVFDPDGNKIEAVTLLSK